MEDKPPRFFKPVPILSLPLCSRPSSFPPVHRGSSSVSLTLLRMQLLRTVSLILPLLSTAFADVEFVDPAAGSTLNSGHVITAHWKDSGKHPKISELSQYDIYLCAGGDTPDSYVGDSFIPILEYFWC